ncbi:hypothetical protein M8C21_027454 [Ambrosia artemisiifolia]|uniref:Uncharacterized protein n=1 Tax=Ambrosia artemisiifolia TaxID=4212 RepID=A0AAD5GAL4_AMBAR|nr:hypothetical protein M8C21_027454 [Ambrosia artemisiifolia]
MTSKKKGMVLPFQPMSLAFDHVNYYVDIPASLMITLPVSTAPVADFTASNAFHHHKVVGLLYRLFFHVLIKVKENGFGPCGYCEERLDQDHGF